MRVLAALACALGCGGTSHPAALPSIACTVHFESETETGRKHSQLVVGPDGGIAWDGVAIGRRTADGQVFEGTTLFATFDHGGVLHLAREPGTLRIAPDGTTTDPRDPHPMLAFSPDNAITGTLAPGHESRLEGPPRCRVDAALAVIVHFQHTFKTEIW